MVQAVNELGYKPKMIGGAMVGLQATVFKQQLGPKLNGIVNYETWVPVGEDDVAGGRSSSRSTRRGRRRRRRSARLLSRRLGLRLHRTCSAKAIDGDQERRRRQARRLAAQDRVQDHHGRLELGPKGEWTKSGMMQVQYHDIKGNGVESWQGHGLRRPCSRRPS